MEELLENNCKISYGSTKDDNTKKLWRTYFLVESWTNGAKLSGTPSSAIPKLIRSVSFFPHAGCAIFLTKTLPNKTDLKIANSHVLDVQNKAKQCCCDIWSMRCELDWTLVKTTVVPGAASRSSFGPFLRHMNAD